MRRAWILGALVLIVVLAATMHLHLVVDGSVPYLLWNADKAYVFVQGGRFGYRMSYLRYLPEPIMERLYYVPSPDETNHYVLVVEITPETVHRFVFKYTDFRVRVPLGQFIYGTTDKGFVKWTGARFEPATPEESQRCRDVGLHLPPDFDNVNGWSKTRGLPEGKTVIKLGGKQVTFVRSGQWPIEDAIDLVHPGRGPERIWYSTSLARRVSKAEYYSVFGKR